MPPASTKFGEKVGIAFQVADDLLDVASDETASGKTPGTDLKEGIPTLVTLSVIAENDPADKELISRLTKPISDEDLSQVIQELRTHKVMEKVKSYLGKIATEAKVRFLSASLAVHSGRSISTSFASVAIFPKYDFTFSTL